ncbi:hypothetical protein GOHSU_38_00370 [Gordonia hirsuta DSM 44140 = NBRC 16056]|uniref:Mce-associated membrane protein n=1 Tax=Gordonia hirsuta DSM 44140 = NBRC 16056 TaxID=1121927 RepID=L7LEB7_9ACTN|nr:hypothetical protein [Gordonia hirsuta]GAC58398.1 hypothetical protein GOHSU_38_00370 [Gordonia hirsuta DSM 44140 = NBRC 16056]
MTDDKPKPTPDEDSTATDEAATDKPATEKPATEKGRQLTVSVRALAVGVVVALVCAALGVLIWQTVSARSELADLRSQEADSAKAEEIAGAYAVAAATLDYKDLTPWVASMKEGVSPELAKQYDLIGSTMEQVLTPLRMQTTAELVLAKTTDVSGDRFRVEAVVNVNTKTIQTPGGGITTAVYGIVLDRADDWIITSVGDPTSAVGAQIGENPDPAPAPVPDPQPAPEPEPGR